MITRRKHISMILILFICLTVSLTPGPISSKTYAIATSVSIEANLALGANFILPITPTQNVPEGFIGVYTKADLDAIRTNLSGNYILMNDIAFTLSDFTLDGTYYNEGYGFAAIGIDTNNAFQGIFDGNGYTISGIEQITTGISKSYGGLFGVTSNAKIHNLGLIDCKFDSSTQTPKSVAYVGGIAGYAIDSIISNCYNSNIVQSTATAESGYAGAYAGGIAGVALRSVLNNCANINSIKASAFATATSSSLFPSSNASAGGIVGDAQISDIASCYNLGVVDVLTSTLCDTNGNACAGGIVGNMQMNGVDSCYNTGKVNARVIAPITSSPAKVFSKAGGIAGATTNNLSSTNTYLINCFNTGDVNSSFSNSDLYATNYAGFSGGITGDANNTNISFCYNIGDVKAPISYSYSYGSWSIANHGHPINGSTGGTIDTCYYLDVFYSGEVNWPSTQYALSEEQMKSQSAFVGFDFSSIWDIGVNSDLPYPNLRANKYLGAPYYCVAFNSQGGSTVASQSIENESLAQSPTVPNKAGYTFRGWFKEAACLNMWDFADDIVTAPITLFAKWTPNSYTIKFSSNSGTSGVMATLPMTYNISKALTANAFKKTGYSFLGWATTPSGAVVYKDKMPVMNLASANGAIITLYAKWGPPITTVTSNSYNSLKISWVYAGSATNYKIYRATSAGGSYSLVYTAASTARYWIDTGQTTGKYYYYKVCPVAGGKTYYHNTNKYAKAIPSTPVVGLSKYSNTSIKVAWSGVSGASGYRIYRATSATGTYSLVYTAKSTTRYWVNTGRTIGKYYYYKVRAYHTEGATNVYGNFSAPRGIKL